MGDDHEVVCLNFTTNAKKSCMIPCNSFLSLRYGIVVYSFLVGEAESFLNAAPEVFFAVGEDPLPMLENMGDDHEEGEGARCFV